jgi:hypothetical protein
MGFNHIHNVYTYILSGCVFISRPLPYELMIKYNILRYTIDISRILCENKKKYNIQDDFLFWEEDGDFSERENDKYYIHIFVNNIHQKTFCHLKGNWTGVDSSENKCFNICKLNFAKSSKKVDFPKSIKPIFDLNQFIDSDKHDKDKIDKLQKILNNKYNLQKYLVNFVGEINDIIWNCDEFEDDLEDEYDDEENDPEYDDNDSDGSDDNFTIIPKK